MFSCFCRENLLFFFVKNKVFISILPFFLIYNEISTDNAVSKLKAD